VPLISVAIVTGLFVMALMNFSTIRKNMQMQIEQQMKTLKAQSEQQIYSRIMDARLKLESTETFTKMAEESPIFSERFIVVDSPDEYYIIVAFLDLS
jgi:mannose/fructose/N-acetylgalactosamine-specific phosphotransferase system component IID